MSLITDDPDDSPRHCATKHHHHHGTGCGRFSGTRRRRLLIAASSAGTSIIALAIILWLTLRPSAPRFSLLAATAAVAGPNATGIARLDAAFVAHNPNARAVALYDRLQLRASYAGGQLAAATEPFQQTQGDVVLTALLSSSSSAAPADEVDAVARETAAGGQSTQLLKLRVEGHLRWKVAAWVSGRRTLAADCVAVVVLQPSQSRAVVVQGSQCATTLQSDE
uniref:Uncharacterized protein n=1 Tax=Avena sativa TaxID=4498 RepID=A0ACD5VHP7_AVESA